MANITTRKREYDANEDATEVKRKVAEAERRQAKNISNILNHVSGDDEKVQASLISKIIDKKGFEFADEVNRRSKALQENKKFSPEQTAALVTDWGNDNKLTKNITAFNKTFGHNPFASRWKVAAARENILPISRYQIMCFLKLTCCVLYEPHWLQI